MALNFRWDRLSGVYQHALEPNMPPSNFFGLRHGIPPSHYQVRGRYKGSWKYGRIA